jgi:hypothetical protein
MTETPLFLVVESQRGVKDDGWQQGVEEEGGGELGEGVLLLDNDNFGQIKGKIKQEMLGKLSNKLIEAIGLNVGRIMLEVTKILCISLLDVGK